MRVLYETVKNQIKNTPLGAMVEVLVSNGTMHCGASPYYTRRGILVDKTDTSIKVLIGKRNFNMKVNRQGDWIDGKWIENEYARSLYNITVVSE